ncbi:ABC transporter ATP-binding protein [Parvularcula sp. IMCC14364]|uniref:ABC transporter ATP-binding protein n=1 Tax=Parvularcula sp. IMCC14364 TaxID=3067902 RepID=UPI00274044EF|nr:ABC transporter ATP-binding protein [Parvularcula sp. IMCC14364]
MSIHPAIEVKNLTFAYQRNQPLLDIEALTIAQGEKVMLAGHSGSGKSTLLGLITGVVEGAAGTLNVLGQDFVSLRASKRDMIRADHIGYIFQSFNLVPYLSVVENVTLPCRLSSVRAGNVQGSTSAIAKRLLQTLGLEDPALLKRSVTALSIGQQQRVATARALIGSPKLVIADEPTSSLDEDAKRDFLTLLLEEADRAGAAVLFVSHDRTLTDSFDRAIMLEQINTAYSARQRETA